MSKKGGQGTSVSRRDFLKTGAAGAVVTGLAGTRGEAAAEVDATLLGPDPVAISLNINGTTQKVEVEPRVTLLDALRNELEVTGAKRVCDRATCGACTVLLDGKLVYACSVLAIEAEGAEITTIEGIGSPEKMHAVQQAFVEHDASQCGFCTPGFVLACRALLEEHPNPTPDQIEMGMGGNLCRCGTYAGISGALAELSKGGH